MCVWGGGRGDRSPPLPRAPSPHPLPPSLPPPSPAPHTICMPLRGWMGGAGWGEEREGDRKGFFWGGGMASLLLVSRVKPKAPSSTFGFNSETKSWVANFWFHTGNKKFHLQLLVSILKCENLARRPLGSKAETQFSNPRRVGKNGGRLLQSSTQGPHWVISFLPFLLFRFENES